jgi:hypothetical protein
MSNLPSIKKSLRRHRLDDEIMVYDESSDAVHLLNSSAADVVDMIESGEKPDSIVTKLNGASGSEAGADILALTLDTLDRAKLVENEGSSILADATRRQMLRRLAAVGAAMLVPAVVTLSPRNASAQGGSLLPNGSACTASAQCASACCGKNSSGSCVSNHCSNPADCGGGANCT